VWPAGLVELLLWLLPVLELLLEPLSLEPELEPLPEWPLPLELLEPLLPELPELPPPPEPLPPRASTAPLAKAIATTVTTVATEVFLK
jgi:hypothetical protein